MNTCILNWGGCSNVRDLGGLMTREGRTTRRGAVVRSDHPAKISAACPGRPGKGGGGNRGYQRRLIYAPLGRCGG